MKKILKLFSGLLLALGLAACSNDFTIAEKLLKNDHTHTFATEWTSNATHHWYAATCEHTEEVKDKAEHTFGDWTITTQPTEEAEGKKERECSVCHYKAEEAIAKLEHTHTYATTYTSDATYHWYAATCGHTTEVKDKAAHTFGDWNITLQPTETTEGSKERECSVCHYKATEPIAELNHTHTYATTYTSDATYHWYAATCGHTTEVKDKAAHTFGDWNITLQPTETTEGSKERECSICHYKATETIAKLAHTHTFATTYSSNATYHWYAATCGHTTEVKDKAEHSFGDYVSNNNATTEADGTKTRTCSVCDYADTVTDVGSRIQIVATPVFSVAAGEVASGTEVKITCTTAGAKIYYTTDGSTPTASSTEYTAAISVTAAVTIKAIAVKGGMNDSAVASTSYTIAYNWYESPVDAVTGNAATSSSTYIYFGVFPKTVLPSTSSVTVDETDSVTMGANTYYKGSDGEYYAKVKENRYGTDNYTYTDTTTVKQSDANSYRYFKVEPIKWKVLTTNYNGKALLLAEEILTANVPYYEDDQNNRNIDGKTVYPNNYKHSQIRAYLNGLSYQGQTSEVTTWSGKGFLQTAFTTTAQSKIAETEVDNKKETTGPSESNYAATYACENTTDKIFLLSESEVINSSYNFAAYNISDNARIRVTTDYAKANYAYQSTNDLYGGRWRLRSPFYLNYYYAREVGDNGNANFDYNRVNYDYVGVVPALSISF